VCDGFLAGRNTVARERKRERERERERSLRNTALNRIVGDSNGLLGFGVVKSE